MNRRKRLHLLIAITSILAVMIAESFIDPNVASAQTCEITSVFGRRRCRAICPPGTFPVCKRTLFSVQCGCERFRGADYWPLPNDPPVDDAELDCAQGLSAYLRSLGNAEAEALANIIDQAVAAIDAQDEATYSDAENNYVAAMENASEWLQNRITEWLADNPDCVWSEGGE